LHVALVADRRPVRVLGFALDAVDGSADLGKARLDLQAVSLQALPELEVAAIVRVGKLEPDHDQLAGFAEEREPGRVGPSMLHRLEHSGHLVADVARAVSMDDAGDPTHVTELLPSRARAGRPDTSGCPSRSRWRGTGSTRPACSA